MGSFSFKCKISGEQVNSNGSGKGDRVHMFLLVNGDVVEYMFGNYNSYGAVYNKEWKHDWSDICDLMRTKNKGDGISIILDRYFDGSVPTTISEDDPEQGWGKILSGKVIKDTVHIVLKEVNIPLYMERYDIFGYLKTESKLKKIIEDGINTMENILSKIEE